MRRMLHYALLFMSLAIMAGNIYAQRLIVIKFSYVNDANSAKGAAVAYFKELVEKSTKGQVRIDVYPNGQLFGDGDELEAVQLGAVQMLAPSISKLSTLGFHQFELFDLPFFFPNEEAADRVARGPVGKKLLKTLEDKRIVGLGFWNSGTKSMFANKPVPTPQSMRGLRMRVQPSDTLSVEMRTLDATAYTLTYPATIEALKKGSIDGLENIPSSFYFPNLVDAPKYLTLTNHGYTGYAVIVNEDFWEKLPAAIRIQISKAMNQTTEYANKVAQQQNELALAAFKKSGKPIIVELTAAQKTQWRNALLPLQKIMASHIGRALINEANEEIAKQKK